MIFYDILWFSIIFLTLVDVRFLCSKCILSLPVRSLKLVVFRFVWTRGTTQKKTPIMSNYHLFALNDLFFCTSHCWGKTIASHGLTSFDDSTQEVSKTFENTFIFWNSLSAGQLILERTPPRKGDIIRPCCLLSLCSFLLKLISSLWSSHGRFCQCLYLEDIGIKVNSSGAAAVFFHNQHWTSKLVRTIF